MGSGSAWGSVTRGVSSPGAVGVAASAPASGSVPSSASASASGSALGLERGIDFRLRVGFGPPVLRPLGFFLSLRHDLAAGPFGRSLG